MAPLQKFVNSTGWHKGDVSWAIGIRYDEMDRVSLTSMLTRNVFYPCVDARVTNKDVIDFWAEQSFNLNIPSHLGNCKWCWKKSKRKLLTIFFDHPEFFDFPLRMEREYALVAGRRRDGIRRAFTAGGCGSPTATGGSPSGCPARCGPPPPSPWSRRRRPGSRSWRVTGTAPPSAPSCAACCTWA